MFINKQMRITLYMCLIETCKASELFISYILAPFLFLWKKLGSRWGGIYAKHIVLSERNETACFMFTCLLSEAWVQLCRNAPNACMHKQEQDLLGIAGFEPHGKQQLGVMTSGCCVRNAMSWGQLWSPPEKRFLGPCSIIMQGNSL